MKIDYDPDSPIWQAWTAGKHLVGRDHKPHSRVTVEPGWWLNTTNVAGSRASNKLPIRYFQRADNSQQELEIPGVRSIDVDYDIDQDVATLNVQLTNNRFDPDYGSSEWQNNNGDFGRPGYMTPDRGSIDNPWGYEPNEWSGLLVRNALCRSYEGYGGHGKTLAQCLADGNLVLTGVWLVDDVPIRTGQGFQLQARNMGKLLVDQYIYPPLVPPGLPPVGDYPMSRARFAYSEVFTPTIVYGSLAGDPLFRILRMERDVSGDGYWLCGTDGGIFTYGRAHFRGSIDSLGITIAPGTYPNEGITGMARSNTGDGYWLCQDQGGVFSFGDAAFHGSISLGDSPPHPVIAIEGAATIDGYWLAGDDGGVFAFGDATFYGSLPPLVAGAKIVDIAAAPDGLGYHLLDDQGHVYSYGSAVYSGGLDSPPSGGAIVAMDVTPSGAGYILVGNDGGVFAFGDAVYNGSIPGLVPSITLNDPVSDIAITPDGGGYWLVAEDGGVFAFGNAHFYGSMPGPSDTVFEAPGNYLDWVDIIKDLALYAGFHLYDGGATDAVYGIMETTGVYAPDQNGNSLDATFFDKLPVIDPMNKIKEVTGFLLTVDDEGGLIFREPNFWESGNWLTSGERVDTVPVIDEKVNLTSYQLNTPDKDLRSEIIISSEDPDLSVAGTVTTSYTPASAIELRGMVRPAVWVNEAFADDATQLTMAELIALHIYFKSRLGTVTCIGNPLLSVDDQAQIVERETFELNSHYVRRIHRTHDRKTGSYTMELTTNVLSPPGDWAVVKPAGSPSGSIVTNRTAV